MTYTYVTMDVSRVAYEEVKAKLEAADYRHAIHDERGEAHPLLDMHGIALRCEDQPNLVEILTEQYLDSAVAECETAVDRVTAARQRYPGDLCNLCGMRRDQHGPPTTIHGFAELVRTVPPEKL